MGNVRNVGVQNRKMSEYGKRQKTLEMSEMSEYGIGRHQKHQKHWSVKYEWKFRAEFKIEYGYITKQVSECRMAQCSSMYTSFSSKVVNSLWYVRCYFVLV